MKHNVDLWWICGDSSNSANTNGSFITRGNDMMSYLVDVYIE